MSPKEPTVAQLAQEVASLRAAVNDANREITRMQRVGGFADSKALSMRSTRIEQRLEVLEFDGTLHKDLTAHAVDLLTSHLIGRHEIAETDNGPDMIFLRKIKRRIAEWTAATLKRSRPSRAAG